MSMTVINTFATQAITTKFLPCTNSKGSRVKASIAAGTSIIANWDHSLTAEQNHSAAAMYLVERMGWSGEWAMGGIKDGYVFVQVHAG